MLDQVIAFADSVNAKSITIRIDKGENTVIVVADRAPGVQFSTQALRNSKGGMLNDMTAIDMLNNQLRNTGVPTRAADKASPKDCDTASHAPACKC
jgi:hypothetical protein